MDYNKEQALEEARTMKSTRAKQVVEAKIETEAHYNKFYVDN